MAAPPKKAKPKQGRNIPQVVGGDAADGHPHLVRKDGSGSQEVPARVARTNLPRTPRLPAIHRLVIQTGPPCAGGRTLPIRARAPAVPAVGRPQLRETAIAGADPDRPHMAHGQQSMTDDYQPAQLTGVPSGLQQMIAVSDASDREAHPFVYLWADPADATTMQTQMEIAASAAIAASVPPAKPTAKAHPATKPPNAEKQPPPHPPPRSWFLPTSASRLMS